MVIDNGDSDSRTHGPRMPGRGRPMRLIRRRPRPEPALLALRSLCHELRPSMALLSTLVDALDARPSGPRHAELTELAAAHVAHARALLQETAAVAAGMTEPPPAAPAP